MSNHTEGNMGKEIAPTRSVDQILAENLADAKRKAAALKAAASNDPGISERPADAAGKTDMFEQMAPQLAEKIARGEKPIDTSKYWWNR